MPFIEREPGVSLFWQDWGEGPALLVTTSYIQDAAALEGLLSVLSDGYRIIRYDTRGTGESTRTGPYDRETDVADLIAVTEAAGPIAAIVSNGDSTNRAVHAAARRPDLFPLVISLETVPLVPGQAEGTEALVASGGVLEALVSTMRLDYRTGLIATIQRGNPQMTEQQLRDRVDAVVAYTEHEAALTRLEEWIRDEPGDDSSALGDRLVIAYEGASAWFPAELIERSRELLPEATFVKLAGGPISRPDLTAAVVRQVTATANAARD